MEFLNYVYYMCTFVYMRVAVACLIYGHLNLISVYCNGIR